MNLPLYSLININIKNVEMVNGIMNIRNKHIKFMSSDQKDTEIPEDIVPTAPKSNDKPDAFLSFFLSSFLTLFRW